MITSKEHDKLCDLTLKYQKSIINLHTATAQELVNAAYEFSHADRELFGYILGLTEEKPADGWIDWPGGECPIEVDTQVAVTFRDGFINTNPNPASNFQWSHVDEDGDVVAYRIV